MSKSFFLKEEIVKDILLTENYISIEDWTLAEEYAKNHDTSTIHYLIDRNLLTRDLFGQAIAEYFKVPYVDFDNYPVTKERIAKISKDIAISSRVIFVEEDKKKVVIVTDNPKQKNLIGLLQPLFKGQKIIIAYALPGNIDNALFWYRTTLSESVAEILEKEKDNAPAVVDALFNEAIVRNVSDIHFEPRNNDVLVRFRVDGVLEEIISFNHSLYEIIVNRIKVSAGLRIDEHFKAQDGALHYNAKDYDVDMRISIVPITEGEKIVIRILGKYVQGLALSEIGLSEKNQDTLIKAAKKPFGMILVTGPTGSGKTTTLYSLVKLLNRPGVNITTIEDPVEYKIPGVNQIQVNEQTGLTFARGLRSIVRQDPDVILVGEIRDKETAEIAVNAALSGHLVLSTFHSNDAATAIPRLLDMGIEPFLLASTLELVIGQRLVRKLREDTRISRTYTNNKLYEMYPKMAPHIMEKEVTFYESAIEEKEGNVPFVGRTALFELIPVTSSIEELVMESPSSRDIWNLAREQGVQSMFEDGLQKLKLGVTTPNELLRVVEPPKSYDKKKKIQKTKE